MYPSYPAWSTPTYSNVGYQLFAYALESITGKPFAEVLYNKVLTPLNLTNTFYWWANETLGIIPGTVNSTQWSAYLGDANA
jgi:CubicO group peptidase (beta-lactamase class C family)